MARAAGPAAPATVARTPAEARSRATRARSDGHVVVISGLSGAGKSQASKLFEDLGYYCVDNLPPDLLDRFLALRDEDPARYRNVALVLDIRAGDPAPAIEAARARPGRARRADAGPLPRGERRDPGQPLQRDAPSPSAPDAERGAGRDPAGARAPRPRARARRPRDRHQRPLDRAAQGAALPLRAARQRRRRAPDRHPDLRLQVRHPDRGRPRLRRALPDQPVLRARPEATLRPADAGPRLRPGAARGAAASSSSWSSCWS